MCSESGNTRPPVRIAVFDIDGTFLLKTSAEIQLIQYLRKQGLLPFRNIIKMFLWLFRLLPSAGFLEATLKNKIYLRGLPVRCIDIILKDFFETQLRPLVIDGVYQQFQELKKKGYQVFFVSATLDFIVQQMVQGLGADGGIGARAEIRDGRFTGRIAGIYPYFREKCRALDILLNGRIIDFRNSYAFADRWEDIPLLSRFGHPVAVNPTGALYRSAKKRGWAVELYCDSSCPAD